MANAPLQKLVEAAQKKAVNDAVDFFEGLLAFSQQEKSVPHYQMSGQQCWQSGAARLLEYTPQGKAIGALFMVPSLINRANLLDLMPDLSLARYMAENGMHCFILDWGEPAEHEKSMGADDYLNKILLPAIERAGRIAGQKISLLGYCMGGLMAIAAAQKLGKSSISKLGLLATPWDFHSDGNHAIKLDDPATKMMKSWIHSMGELPSWFLQPMFYRADPWMFTRKYIKFPSMPVADKNIFVTVERWLNNGVALAPKIAEMCLIDWSRNNSTMAGKWLYDGMAVNPAKLDIPVMAVAPKKDRVVPPSSIEPLLKLMPWAEVLRPDTGHVGIIINKSSPSDIWQPMLEWLTT